MDMSVAPKAIEGNQSMVADVRVRYDITVDIEGEVDWVDDPANAWGGVVDPQPWVRPRWADDATCVISPGSRVSMVRVLALEICGDLGCVESPSSHRVVPSWCLASAGAPISAVASGALTSRLQAEQEQVCAQETATIFEWHRELQHDRGLSMYTSPSSRAASRRIQRALMTPIIAMNRR